jgi:hypothetical protein
MIVLTKHVCVTNYCVRLFVLQNNDEFGDWLFNIKNKFFIAIAHNMKSYDGIFIMDYIIKGRKLLVIKFVGIKIIDLINFIPMALLKMPKTFGLSELKKRYFPHLFTLRLVKNMLDIILL